jgi:hypothetical protein
MLMPAADVTKLPDLTLSPAAGVPAPAVYGDLRLAKAWLNRALT